MKRLLLFAFILPIVPIFGQESLPESLLTVERTRLSGEFKTVEPSVDWREDGTLLLLEPSSEPCGGNDILAVDPVTQERQILVRATELVPQDSPVSLAVEHFDFSRSGNKVLLLTNSQKVWRQETRGDYWVFDRTSRRLQKLGVDAKPSSLMFAKFSPGEQHVAYARENDLFVENLDSGRGVRLTDSGGDRFVNGTFDWVYEEEFDLRDGFRWSPDGKKIAFWQLDTSREGRQTLIDNTGSLYPTVRQFPYPKAGTPNAASRIGVVAIDAPERECWVPLPGDPSEHYIVSCDWLCEENTLLIRQMNRLQNELRFFSVSEKDGFQRPENFWTETDPAWIDLTELHRLSDGNRFVFASERDGWNHLYWIDRRDPDSLRLLTPGNWDVIEVLGFDGGGEVPESGIYFSASPQNATQQYLYRAALDGSEVRRITPPGRPGTHTYEISPDGRLAYHTESRFGSPPVCELVRLPSHETVRIESDNAELREKLARLQLGRTEMFSIRIEDGTSLDGWCIEPVNFDPTKKYPLLLYVYGEPAGQTVLDRWGGEQYLWFQMLAQKGYFVMSFDNRGTPAPKGRDWRKSVFRQVGVLGPKDQAAALREVLKQRPYLDADRVGIWGWSGGGSMSLHAIFQYPDLYKTAVAIAPVTDERYYDTIYQERYLGLPQENPEAYRNSSPITYAEGLRGNLLLVHGTADDNTHYQAFELLLDELIRRNKTFSMMSYPNRTHSLSEGSGTRRHFWNLITNYLLEKL